MGIALITGASSGLGLEFAWQLATARHDLVLVARDEERLTRLAAQLEAAAGIRAQVLVADLANRADVEQVAQRLRSTEHPIGLLVNNAGFGSSGSFIDDDLTAQEQALEVMVRAVMVLSHAAADSMRERGRGAILNVGSVAGLMTSGTYSAHKAWVQVFTESLAAELQDTGVSATVLRPGLTRTEFHERARMDVRGYPEAAWLTAEQVVSQALGDVRRGSVISTPSVRYTAAAALLNLLPRPLVRAISGGRNSLLHMGQDETA